MDNITNYLEDILKVKFVLHESDYVGVYKKYSGDYCDSLKVLKNKSPDLDYILEEEKDFVTIIEIALEDGKNLKKENNNIFLKNTFLNIPETYLVSEDIYED